MIFFPIFYNRCEVQNDTEASCPEPVATAFDHHEGEISEKLTKAIILVVESNPASKPEPVNRPVQNVSYNQRGEYLFTYSATDSSGNEAEEVQFAMIMADRVGPTFNAIVGLPTTLEARKNWNKCVSIDNNHTFQIWPRGRQIFPKCLPTDFFWEPPWHQNS